VKLQLADDLSLPADEAVTQKCACGCGLPSPIAARTRPDKGHIQGQPTLYRAGHNKRNLDRAKQRYRFVSRPDHPRGPVVYEHIIIAEAALGRYLPEPAQVHHFDEDTQNNTNRNLVICEDQSYHQLLHVRTRILRAGGNPNTDAICKGCGPRPITAFNKQATNRSTGVQGVCRDCSRAADRRRA
jgi:hypothetical protein